MNEHIRCDDLNTTSSYFIADPSPAVNLTSTVQSTTHLTLSWEGPNDTNSHLYQYKMALSQDGLQMVMKTINATSFNFTNLSPGTIYSANITTLFNGRTSEPVKISLSTGMEKN